MPGNRTSERRDQLMADSAHPVIPRMTYQEIQAERRCFAVHREFLLDLLHAHRGAPTNMLPCVASGAWSLARWHVARNRSICRSAMPSDQLIGDIVEVVADDVRLRSNSQHIVSGAFN